MKGIHWQTLERPDTLSERRKRGVDPAQVRDSIHLPLENACIDRLSNGDPNSATHGPKLQTRRRMQRLGQSVHVLEEAKSSRRRGHVLQGHGGLQRDEWRLKENQQTRTRTVVAIPGTNSRWQQSKV